jgi:hypothetical protein
MAMRTRVAWWIRDGPATWKGDDIIPGQVTVEEAEQLLSKATAQCNRDLKTLPKFCATFYECEASEDWGIINCEKE